ncbi:MAG: hypothetical protein Q8P59_06155 [Dehalococcoidia bacterium]|nr:hypothetical protein [Dehalococcoidia bacterium]
MSKKPSPTLDPGMAALTGGPPPSNPMMDLKESMMASKGKGRATKPVNPFAPKAKVAKAKAKAKAPKRASKPATAARKGSKSSFKSR